MLLRTALTVSFALPIHWNLVIFSNSVPPNCNFQIFDAEEQRNFSRIFNFIYIRNPTGFKLFKNVLNSAYQSLDDGGWLEIQDIMFRLKSDGNDGNDGNDGDDGDEPAHLRLWEKDVLDRSHHLQYNLEKAYHDLMRDQGFKEIKCVVKKKAYLV
jgi:hypothetical protein